MSLTVDVFAYTLAGTLAVVDAVAFGQRQRPLYDRTCRSLAFIIARESYFVWVLIAYFFLPPSFSQDGIGLALVIRRRIALRQMPQLSTRTTSTWRLPATKAMSDHWDCHLTALYASGRAGNQRHVGPSVSCITRRWTADPFTTCFQPLQDDECLVPYFDSFRHSQRPRVALVDAMMELSGALGHMKIEQ